MAAHHRLDRLVRKLTQFQQSDVRHLLAQGRIQVDGRTPERANLRVSEFSTLVLDGEVIQHKTPIHILLNKPPGVICATKDARHKTVMACVDHPQIATLHVPGRLDLNSTGMVLLTNDGTWSRQLFMPGNKVKKCYQVTLERAVPRAVQMQYQQRFSQGIYFAFEGITTLPAQLTFSSETQAIVELVEGKYHQVKRMFGYFDNKVLSLQRTAIGGLALDDPSLGELNEGDWCLLNPEQTAKISLGKT